MTTSHRHPTWILFTAALTIATSWADHGRADAPPNRYIVDNGTVTDTMTQLIWEQTFSDFRTIWAAADDYCQTLNLNGSTDWRVPSMKELQTIVDETRTNPAIDPNVFPCTTNDFFWTSSIVVVDNMNHWVVRFADGCTTGGNGNACGATASPNRVRCVR